MTSCLIISEFLTMTEINHIDETALMTKPDDKIFKTNISVNITQLMDLLQSIKYLQPNQKTGLLTEPIITEFMELGNIRA